MNLAFGDISVRLNLPEGRLRTVISPTLPTTSTSASQLIAVALDQCAPHFGQFRIGERVVIVTSDITRYTGSEQYLPLLVDELNRRGIQDRDITILIALGIHRKQTEAEHRRIVGPLYDRLSVVDHDCDNPGKLVTVGRTSNGIDVTVNRLVVEADRLILTGTIGFHYFAGFSGGRKALLPGVAGRKSCLASHFAVLHPEPGMGRHPQATTGILDGNPVHEALCDACSMVGPDLIFNTILSPDNGMRRIGPGAGSMPSIFRIPSGSRPTS
jgi:nickel-dependent lactate racemase